MLTRTALFCLFVTLFFISHTKCEKSLQVVEEFDAAHVSKHYEFTLMGVEIFTLRSKPVLTLLKERDDTGDQNDADKVTTDLFSLDWDKWWSERGEPLFQALKQNPHFMVAVCFMVAVVRGLRRSVIRETIGVETLVEQITDVLSAQSLETKQRMEDLALEVQQVTRNQDVIARAFARVISILRDSDHIESD